jgi:hypothetical protein
MLRRVLPPLVVIVLILAVSQNWLGAREAFDATTRWAGERLGQEVRESVEEQRQRQEERQRQRELQRQSPPVVPSPP